ncbi:MAG: pentapeptide repeat-containing protein [Rothia dentocariosa]|uniref:Pentapeptide repeat-containing protein n=1 Tax=Rothia dentocariosa TaxID=2047 RepID=A0A930PEV2_9MICC|nr:pentapeptide repeat-containing protein [Rothia dentocariosa]
MTENNTQECKDPQAEDTALSTSDSPLDVLSSIIKPQTRKEYVLPVLICIITLVHFLVFPQLDSFWINIIRLSLSVLTIIYIRNIAHKAYNKRVDIIKSFNNSQPQFFTIIVVFGGTLAILIPMIMNVTKLIGDGAPLTTALLGITGGIIAIFGYYKTHQKSELEKEQLEIQKQKDARDHIRQLHGSYNDRFDKAVAELNGSDVKAAYAAVPKLAKLADAWLDYKDLSNNKKELKKLKKKAKKEAQTIINILCKYVRTMPGEYTEENLKNIGALNSTDQDSLKNESEVRRLIFSEMSHRSSKANFENENSTTTPGIWSKFNFDFTGAPIFYPLNNLKIEKGIFTSARFYSNADFRESTFIKDVDFKGVQFTQEASFNEATFNGKADFSTQGDAKTTFVGKASFNGADFSSEAHFDELTFIEVADFSTRDNAKTTFAGNTTFNGTYFTREAKFTEVTFNESVSFSTQSDIKTVFKEQATFNDVQFHKEISFNTVIFEGIADFSTQKIESFDETFMSDAKFINTHFKKTANFSYVHSHSNNNSHKIYFKQVDFHEDSLFNNTEFLTDVHFEKVVFHGAAKFNDAHFLMSVKFDHKTHFKEEANFSDLIIDGAAEFNVYFDNNSYFNGAEIGNPNLINQQKTIFYESRFDGEANFSNAHFNNVNEFIDLCFLGETSFYSTEFANDTYFIQNPGKIFALNKFTSPKYKEKAEFSDAKFEGKLHFENIEFNDGADFIRTVFYKESNFENSLFKNSSPDFKDAKFTVHSSHRFTTSQNSIPCRREKVRAPRNHKLKAHKIPIGSYLFDNDPDNPIAGPA